MADYNSAEAGIDVFEIIDGLPVSSDWKSFLTHHNDAKRLFRVDLSVQDPATLNELIGAIHQTPLVMKRCLDSNNVSGVHVYDNMLAIQLPVADDWEASIHPKLTILCLSNALITVRTAVQANNSSDTPDELATFSNRPLGLEGLLFSLLDTIVDRAGDLTLKAHLSVSVDQLETDMPQNC